MMNTFISHCLVWTIALPFLGGLAAFFTRRRYSSLAGVLSAAVINLLTGVLAFAVHQTGIQRYEIGGWRRPLGIDLQLDGLSAVMLVLTALVGLCVSIYASGYFSPKPDSGNSDESRRDPSGRFFWPLWLFTWGGLNALFLSSDIFNIYVCLEIMTFGAIALVALAGSLESVSAALRYLLISLLGSLMYLLGVGLLYSGYGILDLYLLETVIRPETVSVLAVTLISLAFVIKGALFPMHFWLPPAHANAPAPVSAVLSGLVIMAAFYLLVRFWFSAFAAIMTPAAGHLFGGLGVFALSYGGLQALRQPRLKMIIAYSTVAQIGYMFLLFPLAAVDSTGQIFAWNGGIYFAVSHACAKGAAFLVAGSVVWSLGHDRIEDLGGLARRYPVGTFTFAIAGLSLAGLPPSGGFVGKWLLLKAAMLSGQWWYAVMIIAGGLLAAGYVIRVLEIAMRAPENEEVPGEVLRIPLRMQYSALALAFAAVLMGLLASVPLDILNISAPVSFNQTGEL